MDKRQETIQMLRAASLAMDFPEKRKGYFRPGIMKCFVAIMIGLIVSIIISSLVYGADWEVSVAYCPDIFLSDLRSDGLDHDALELEVKHPIKGPWYGALSLRRLHATLEYPHVIDGQYFQGNETTLDASLRLGLEHNFIGALYGSVFGGFGYMFDHRQPEFGDSGILAHIGVMLLIKNDNWKIGYGLAHYSDPTQGSDFGRNYSLFMLGYIW